MKRILIIGAAGAAVLLVVAVVLVVTSLDRGLKVAIETYGSAMAQVSVTVDSVSVDLGEGQVRISGLVVGSPEGFKADHAFALGSIEIDLDVGSLGGDPITIEKILIEEASVIYEVGLGKTNIGALQSNVEEYLGSESAAGSDTRTGGGGVDDAGGGPKLVIDDFWFKGGQVKLAEASGTAGVAAPLPDIHLRDIGKASGGATVAEVVQQTLGSLSKGTLKAVTSINLGTLESAGKALQDGAKGTLRKLFR